jgi:hypothetical protein
MKKIMTALWVLMMLAGPAANAFAAYTSTNENNTIDWYNVIDGDIATAGDDWSFVLEPGTDRYSVLDLDRAEISAVPLPGALWLLGSGMLGLVGLRRRR